MKIKMSPNYITVCTIIRFFILLILQLFCTTAGLGSKRLDTV